MAENNDPNANPNPNQPDPPSPKPPSSAATTTNDPPVDDDPGRDRDEKVSDLERAVRRHKARQKALENEVAEITAARRAAEVARDEALSSVTTAEAAQNVRLIKSEVRVAAIRAGLTDLDLLAAATPFLDKVTINPNGDVEGADDAIAAFKSAKPNLFGIAPATTTTTAARVPSPNPSGPEPFNARTATPEEYAAQKRKALGR